MPEAFRIGLTGGIGSGKSTVAARLVARGAALIDTDAIAHALTATGGAAMPALRETFGSLAVAPDGALDRAYMRQTVFADPSARQRLESILHPLIAEQAAAQALAAQRGGSPVLVFDVPLLAESGRWRGRCDRILVVDSSVDSQVGRVRARSGWSEEQVRRVIAQQAGRAARRAIADAVIHNDGLELAALAAEVDALWDAWRAHFRPPA